MFRRKGRLLLTQGVLIVAGTMFLLVMSLAKSVNVTLANDMARRGFDIRIRFENLQRIDRVVSMAKKVAGVKEAEVWFSHNAALLKQGQRVREAGVGAQINGIPDNSQMFKPLMIQGRWLEPNDGRVVVISKDMADDNHLKIGDKITLNLGELGKDDWQVVGVFLVVYNAGFDSDPIYAPLDALFEATKKHNEGSRLLISANNRDKAQVAALFAELKGIFEGRDMDINLFESNTTIQDTINADAQFAIIINMLIALALIVAIVGGVGLMGALSISVVERIREIGVMRAIGAQSLILMGMFVMEGILQGLLSWIIAVPLSFALGQPIAYQLGQIMLQMDLDYVYSYEAIIIWLIIILAISIIASILPARSATKVSVRESLAYS
jgi:putative ABC transport system permease protein